MAAPGQVKQAESLNNNFIGHLNPFPKQLVHRDDTDEIANLFRDQDDFFFSILFLENYEIVRLNDCFQQKKTPENGLLESPRLFRNIYHQSKQLGLTTVLLCDQQL